MNPVLAVESAVVENRSESPSDPQVEEAVVELPRGEYRLMFELASEGAKGSLVLGADALPEENGVRIISRIVKLEWGKNRVEPAVLRRLPELEFALALAGGKYLTGSGIDLEVQVRPGKDGAPATVFHLEGSMTVEILQPTGNLSGTCRGRLKVLGPADSERRSFSVWGTVTAWKL